MLISAEKEKGYFLLKKRALIIIYIYVCLWLFAKKNPYVYACYSVT